MLGREVTKLLISKGEQVRLLTRFPAKVDDLKRKGAEIAVGDLTNSASLSKACTGVDRILAAAHSMLGSGRNRSEAVDDAGHRSLIDIAAAAGIRHFVYTSLMGASPDHPVDFWRTKYRVENYLKASGLGYTILRPSAFMEWHAHEFNGKSILEEGSTRLMGVGSKLRNFVAVRDVAHFATLALTTEALQNRTLEIGGPRNYSNHEVALLYGEIAGVTPKISHLPAPVAKGISLVLKPFLPGVSRVLHIGSLPENAFDEQFDADPLLAEFPVQLTSLEEFIRERCAEKQAKPAA
jgi:NADH dehydrogenase